MTQHSSTYLQVNVNPRRVKLSALAACSSVLLSMGAVQAEIIEGTGDIRLEPALAGGRTVTFDQLRSTSYASLTVGNVTFRMVGTLFNISADYAGQFNTRGKKSLQTNASIDVLPQVLRFDFAAPVSAFGFYWGASDFIWDLHAFDASGKLLDAQALPILNDSNQGNYFGLKANDIAYATLANRLLSATEHAFVDNFTYTQVIPEPGTGFLTLAGLGILGAAVRRRRPCAAWNG